LSLSMRRPISPGGERRRELNDAVEEAGLPLRFEGMQTVWTVIYTRPSRFNWVYQFYLRAHGLELAWTGTGRLIFSLNYSDEDFLQVRRALLDAAAEMHRDGWWWGEGTLTHGEIRKQLIREMLGAALPGAAPAGPRGIRAAEPSTQLEETA
jgi:glutamate-1-semialdehyde 2,1-aminomutase